MVAQGACMVALGGMHGCSGGACMVFLGGMHGFFWGTCMFFPGGIHRIQRDMVNERAVCILLQCILVSLIFAVKCRY